MRMLVHFFKNCRGGVAPMMALAALPLMGSVGVAVDYSRASAARTAFQGALDSTALMLSKTAATQSGAELQSTATGYFNALFARADVNNIAITANYSSTNGSKVTVSGSATINTNFLGVLGYSHLNITASTTLAWGNKRLRVALVLDNTGSMSSSNKMSALKTASQGLLTQLKDAAVSADDVYVSIVPFSKDVNVGAGNYNETWLSWDLWEAVNGTCSNSNYHTKNSCTSHNKVWTPASHSSWNGCVTDRGDVGAPNSANYDQNVAAPSTSIAASRYPAENYSSCPVTMMGLNYNWTSMNSLVDSMQPDGNTNQPIGLVWAWRSLVGGGPLTAPAKDSNYQYQDVMRPDVGRLEYGKSLVEQSDPGRQTNV